MSWAIGSKNDGWQKVVKYVIDEKTEKVFFIHCQASTMIVGSPYDMRHSQKRYGCCCILGEYEPSCLFTTFVKATFCFTIAFIWEYITPSPNRVDSYFYIFGIVLEPFSLSCIPMWIFFSHHLKGLEYLTPKINTKFILLSSMQNASGLTLCKQWYWNWIQLFRWKMKQSLKMLTDTCFWHLIPLISRGNVHLIHEQ